MGFRFQRRVRLFPGVSINFGRNGASLSVGPRGLKTTFSSRGIRHSFGLPGTGMSYQTPYHKWGGRSPKPAPAKNRPAPTKPPQTSRQRDYQKLNLGFFAKLSLCAEEKHLAEGVQAFIAGDIARAETLLRQALCYADAAFTLAFILLNNGRYADALPLFEQAEKDPKQIGAFYKKYKLEMTLTLCISPFLTVELPPSQLTACLGHVEALQHGKRATDACNLLLALHRQNPQDILVTVSLAELVLETSPSDQAWMTALVNLSKDVENESYPHAVLLMYKAEALDNLGMTDAAIAALTSALRKRADRPQGFLMEIQYQRGTLYMKGGKNALAKKDLQTVFAVDPAYANVRELLARLA